MYDKTTFYHFLLLATVYTGYSQQSQRLNTGWNFIKQDLGGIWELVRPITPGNPESVPLWQNVTLPHCFNARDAVDPDVNYYQVVTESEDFQDSEVDISLDVDSIDTAQDSRDQHLKSAEFFDAATYPKITFKSTSLKKVSGSDYKLEGNLTIKDVTKPVILDVEFGGSAADFYG